VRRHAKALLAISALLLLTLAIGVTMAVATAPTVTLEDASSVTYTSAEVSGKVDPKDEETTYRFQYTSDSGQGWIDGEENPPLAAGSGEASVSEELTGLKPGTGYYVRLVAENADGQTTSSKSAPLFTTVVVPPPSVSILPPDPLTATEATLRGEINSGGTDPAFDVTWHFVCNPECVNLTFGSIPTDGNDHQVSRSSSTLGEPLKPNTTYEATLIAENVGGQASSGPLSFTTPAMPPQISEAFASPLPTEATLRAKINPGGLSTEYRFEYGPTAAYGSATATRSIDGGVAMPVQGLLRNLTPGTTLHFRVVAENALGTVEGPDRAFTTPGFDTVDSCANAGIRVLQGAAQLGNCRAFEKVSPADKTGADVSLFASQSSVDGNAVAYQSSGAFSGAEGAGHADSYIGRRGPDGWATEPLAPYQTPNAFGPLFDLNGYERLSADLSKGVLMAWHDPNERNAEVDADQQALFLRGAGGTYTRLTPSVMPPPIFFKAEFVGASEDLTRIFFESMAHLTPDAPPTGTSEVYEWANGEVSVVGVLPDGTVAPQGATTSSLTGNLGLSNSRSDRKWAVSADGSDVVFQSGSPKQIYLRSDGATTTPVSLSQKAGSEGESAETGARFLAGTRDASGGFAKLYFTSSTELTDDAFTGPAQEGNDLYEYDVASGELRDLTVSEGPGSPNGAEVHSEWFRASADGDYLYFFADGGLDPDGGQQSLYVIHDGQTKLVGNVGETEPFVSATGKRVLIFTAKRLTAEADGASTQAYVYDEPSGAIDCISCAPGKASSKATFRGFLTGYSHPTDAEPNAISADGSRAFFQTATALDPRDNNGTTDVYQWENGKVSLISSGRGTEGANFLAASPSGDDVFIVTTERLLPSDRDLNLDVYDARIGGGFPMPPSPGVPCEGDACQTPPSPPNDATPASAGFSGPGNAKERFAKPRKQAKQKKKAKARHKQRAKQKQAKKKRGAKKRAQARQSTRGNG
jgi:hypothetical protein